MRRILPADLSFDDLHRRLATQGWHHIATAALRAPLRIGEPEQARFEKADKVLIYSYNPMIDLRCLEGDIDAGLPAVGAAQIVDWLDSADDTIRARGCLAASEMGLTHLLAQVRNVTQHLPGPLKPMGQAALQRLRKLPPPAQTGAFDVLTLPLKLQTLRTLLHSNPRAAAALVPRCWHDGPELAATAMITAARFDLRDQGLAIKRADLSSMARTIRDREVFFALKKACLASLSGQSPGPECSAKNRFWRCVLGHSSDIDDAALLIHALSTPLPDVPETSPPDGFATLPAVAHWLGHDMSKGLPNPLRLWQPEQPLLIASTPSTRVARSGIDELLCTLSDATTQPLRLPTQSEWEAALRGPDARPYPWGVDPAFAALPMSPWGAIWSGQPEWATKDDALVICGDDPTGRVAFVTVAEADTRAAIRAVVQA